MDAWWVEHGDLDQDQLDVIGLPDEGSYLVKGPPGSGKTNLLLRRANYLTVGSHPNLAIIVFNATLREFIRSGAERYDFNVENVQTSATLFNQLLYEADQEVTQTGDFSADRMSRAQAVERLLSARSRRPIFDVLLVDEAQDFLPLEISLFRELATDLFFVADSRQRIYSGESPMERLEGAVGRTLNLRYHYRNGPPICEVADSIGSTFSMGYDPILPSCNYNARDLVPSVDVFAGGLVEQAEEIARRLQLQRRTYPEGFLGVVCPNARSMRRLAEVLQRTNLRDQLCVQDSSEMYVPVDASTPIWVSTIHGAKGLEFRALHLAAADEISRAGAGQKRLAYTGVTRAKTALSIYYEGHLPAYLDRAVDPFRPDDGSTTLSVSDAFGPR